MTKQKICGLPDCSERRVARKLCRRHYDSRRYSGHFTGQRSARARFESKIDKNCPTLPGNDQLGPCWLWVGAVTTGDYGRLGAPGINGEKRAHRVALVLAGVSIPSGMVADHRCHKRTCVRPSHLRVVTRRQNSQNRKGANRNSKSGIRGVTWNHERRGWLARVTDSDGQCVTLGKFDTPEAAEEAVMAWRKENAPHGILAPNKEQG